jgi:hypothetical protein
MDRKSTISNSSGTPPGGNKPLREFVLKEHRHERELLVPNTQPMKDHRFDGVAYRDHLDVRFAALPDQAHRQYRVRRTFQPQAPDGPRGKNLTGALLGSPFPMQDKRGPEKGVGVECLDLLSG